MPLCNDMPLIPAGTIDVVDNIRCPLPVCCAWQITMDHSVIRRGVTLNKYMWWIDGISSSVRVVRDPVSAPEQDFFESQIVALQDDILHRCILGPIPDTEFDEWVEGFLPPSVRRLCGGGGENHGSSAPSTQPKKRLRPEEEGDDDHQPKTKSSSCPICELDIDKFEFCPRQRLVRHKPTLCQNPGCRLDVKVWPVCAATGQNHPTAD